MIGKNVHRRPRRPGVAIMWVAICSLLLLSVIALTIDSARALFATHQLQNAADAAALAGALQLIELVNDDAAVRTAAIGIAVANRAAEQGVQLTDNASNAAGGDIVVGLYHRELRTFTPTDLSTGIEFSNAVQVRARRTDNSLGGAVNLIFNSVLGRDDVNISRPAIAMLAGGTGSGLIALNQTQPCSLMLRGTSMVLDVEGGAIQVNSNHDDAVCHSGQPTVVTPELNVKGDCEGGGCDTEAVTDKNFDQVDLSGHLQPDIGPLYDPLAGLLPPSWDPLADLGEIDITGNDSETVSATAGFYSGGISMRNDGATLTLGSGVYVLDGKGLQVRGGNLIAHEVMFYIVDSTPNDNKESELYLGGNGVLEITPPSSGYYEGISIFQARDNHNDATIIGTNNMNLVGTLYFPENHLHVGGTGDGFGTQLIADTIEVFGTGNVIINYDGRNPARGGRVFLVQ